MELVTDFLLFSMISLVSAEGTPTNPPQTKQTLVAHVGFLAYFRRTFSIELIRKSFFLPLLNLYLDYEITGVDVHRKSPNLKKGKENPSSLGVFSILSPPPPDVCNFENKIYHTEKRT